MKKISILLIALMVISVGFLSGCTDSQSNGEVEDNDDVIFVAWITPAIQDLQERLDYDSEKTDDLYWDGWIVSLINAVENYEAQIINFNVSSKWQLVYSLFIEGCNFSVEGASYISDWLEILVEEGWWVNESIEDEMNTLFSLAQSRLYEAENAFDECEAEIKIIQLTDTMQD